MRIRWRQFRCLPARMCACAAMGLFFMICASSWAQEALGNVQIRVHADQTVGAIAPIWDFFGYDEPNYTYAPNGKNCWESCRRSVPHLSRYASTTFSPRATVPPHLS